jgi:hypothetical protein
LAKGIGDVMVADIDFEVRVRDAKIPDPGKIGDKGAGKSECGLVGLVHPVVDGMTPAVRPTGSGTNNPRVLVRVLKIDDAMRGLLYIIQEIHDIWV